MTREEARKAAKVMLDYADGKQIEFCYSDDTEGEEWEERDAPLFNWECCVYRVKPELKYRPFKDANEAFTEAKKHDFYIKCIGMLGNGEPLHNHSTYFKIGTINDEAVHIGWFENHSSLLRNYIWADDGTPCGIKQQ